MELMAACGKAMPAMFRDKKSIGSMVREIRKSRNMSQMLLAEKLEISYQQVQKYEKGLNAFTTDRLNQLALALDVPLTAFME